MPEMTDDEKAARLLFYKQQAEAQWEGRKSALRSFSKPFFILNRMGLYASVALAVVLAVTVVLIGLADHHYLGALALVIAVPLSLPMLRQIRRGDVYPVTKGDAKPQLVSLLAFLLWWALYLGICVISVMDQMRSA